MKTEHKRFRQILDLIWFRYSKMKRLPYYFNEERQQFWYDFAKWKTNIRKDPKIYNSIPIDYTEYDFIVIDVREIIFTPEFMDKFIDFWWFNKEWNKVIDLIVLHLDNPTLYLYNLLGKWIKSRN
jgi:hypothetical protein